MIKTVKHLAVTVLAPLVGTAALLAQQAAPPAAQTPPSQTPPPSQQAAPPKGAPAQQPAAERMPQQPTFRIAVDLVRTDVIVRDGRDQFIADLKPSEFEVWEDGVKQDIVSVSLTHGGRTYNTLSVAPPPPQEGIILPPPRPTNDAAGRIFILFVDDLHMDFRNTGRIRELFKKIKNELIHEGDMFGIVSTGPSSLAIDLTYDRKRLDEALKKISGAGLKPSDILMGSESADGPSEVRYRAHVAFRTAWDLMKNLEQVHNRRKAMIYVSDGYDFNPFATSRQKARAEMQPNAGQNQDGVSQDDTSELWGRQGQQFAEADLARELADLTRTANRANVTMYTIDPRGLVGMPDLDEQVDMTEWQDYIRKSQDSLRVLAEETGGIAVVNQNDFNKALKRIDAETSDYYVLGYYSSNPDPLRRNRQIEVKVTRPDANVWSRRGYTLKPTPKVK